MEMGKIPSLLDDAVQKRKSKVSKTKFMLEVKDITKIYKMGDSEVHALDGVSLKIEAGDFIAIMGPSGSGKSTLSNMLGLLDTPTTGSYSLNGRDISKLSEDDLAILRRDEIGFIFQQFNLLPRLSAQENVELPLLYSKNEVESGRAKELLKLVALDGRENHLPNELSGGQQQRVAIARSLINNPRIIFADEPTGNLDSKSEKEILDILHQLNDQGITVIMVTHEDEIGRQTKRLIKMRDGKIVSDERLAPINKDAPQISPYSKPHPSFIGDIIEYFKQGVKTLMANKIRSALSMLGILIGVAAVVAILALGKGAKESMKEQLSTLGSNLLILRPGNRMRAGVSYEGGAIKFYPEDADYLKERIDSIEAISPIAESRVQVAYEGKNNNTILAGVVPSYTKIRNWTVDVGRFFTDEENQGRKKVCLLGRAVTDELFPGKNPVGETIKINRISFQVIGVLGEKSGGGYRDPNDVIIVPLLTAMRRLLGQETVNKLEVMVRKLDEIPETEKILKSVILARKRVPPSQQENAIRIFNMSDIQDMIKKSNDTISTLLIAVACISLLVGGIGIMNIMLVSVTERTREIGLRKSLGAKRKDILLQFLSESVVLSAIGGAAGIFIAWLITSILAKFAGWNTSISIISVVSSFVFSSFIGILFGIYPAANAAKLNPIDALRHD